MLKAIRDKVLFFIAVIIDNLEGILDFLLLLALAICAQSDISLSCNEARPLALSFIVLFFLFFSLLKGFLNFRALFNLVGLILGL